MAYSNECLFKKPRELWRILQLLLRWDRVLYLESDIVKIEALGGLIAGLVAAKRGEMATVLPSGTSSSICLFGEEIHSDYYVCMYSPCGLVLPVIC